MKIPKPTCVVIGDDGKSAISVAEVLKTGGITVLRTGRWDGESGSIMFVRRSDTEEIWALRRFCDGAGTVVVASERKATIGPDVGDEQEVAIPAESPQDAQFPAPFHNNRSGHDGVIVSNARTGTPEPVADICDPRYPNLGGDVGDNVSCG